LSVASEKSDRSGKMAKMIDPNKPLTQLELDIVYLRYYEGLHSSEKEKSFTMVGLHNLECSA
jgi:hypothetical protein